jgi:hypothetical protein
MKRAGEGSATDRQAAFLKTYAKGKPLTNYGGNFWGISRNRCTILKPDQIEALILAGYMKRDGHRLLMILD